MQGDWNACGPAATTNSFSWLRTQHPEIEDPLGEAFGQGDTSMRQMLADLSDLMDRTENGTVKIKDFIEGKLAFIDKHKLPVHVKFQSISILEDDIASPNNDFDHEAENMNEPGTPEMPYARINLEWIYEEMAKGEDVELFLIWVTTDPDGNLEFNKGHFVTLSGIRKNNDNWRIKWKDDDNQAETSPSDLRHGISNVTPEDDDNLPTALQGLLHVENLDDPFLGRCYIKDVVSESYDSTITFPEPISFQIDEVRRVNVVAPIATGAEKACLKFTYDLPPGKGTQFLNVCRFLPDGTTEWVLMNIALCPFDGPLTITTYFDVEEGVDNLDLGVTITEELQVNKPPADFVQMLELLDEDHNFGSGIPPGEGGTGEAQEEFIIVFENGDTLKKIQRGCNVPSIDLDSMNNMPNDTCAGDWNGCAPAATANSFSWLRQNHPEIDSILEAKYGVQGPEALRKLFKEFGQQMNRQPNEGVFPEDILKGKLGLIDECRLPMRVKFQSIFIEKNIVTPSECTINFAENQNETPPADAPNGVISMDWLFGEMQHGEDVELNIQWWDPVDQEFVAGHAVVVVGIEMPGNNWRIYFKDDTRQDIEDPNKLRLACVDIIKTPEDYPDPFFRCVWRMPQLDYGRYQAILGGVYSESYDPTIEHPPVTGPKPEVEFGDAPEGALAYVPYPGIPNPAAAPGTFGAFPTCIEAPQAGFVKHGHAEEKLLFIGAGMDSEWEGNSGPPCVFPAYDKDECLLGGDADPGMIPQPYTLDAAFNYTLCPGSLGAQLEFPCEVVNWGTDIDFTVTNNLTDDRIAFLNVLIDWNQDGKWGGASVCPDGTPAFEHVAINVIIPNGYAGPASGLGVINFPAGPNSGFLWMRISVTDSQVQADWDGSGGFGYGETEDHLTVCAEEYGDAPEGKLAYSDPIVIWQFPTCRLSGASGFIRHGNLFGYFGDGKDFEIDGNAGNCPQFNPYDNDECSNDLIVPQPPGPAMIDAGLLIADVYTINGDTCKACSGSPGITTLGKPCETVIWGVGIDMSVTNNVPTGQNLYLNVLADLNRDGKWSGAVTCPDGTVQEEHIVKNLIVPAGTFLASGLGAPQFNLGPEGGPIWVRFSLTETMQGANWNGSGTFEYGETEDYLIKVEDDGSSGFAFDYGDAPEDALAYPETGQFGRFPTCLSPEIQDSTWIRHFGTLVYFGELWDAEVDGNAALCPDFDPYDADECFDDTDAGLIRPRPFTIIGTDIDECTDPGTYLGYPYELVSWGEDIDIFITNNLDQGDEVYLNVLMDWNQNGMWGDTVTTVAGDLSEHVIQNFPIPSNFSGPVSSLFPPDFFLGPNAGHVWARFSLTEEKVKVGRAGQGHYQWGETEDYLLGIEFCPDNITFNFNDGPTPAGFYQAGTITSSVPVANGPTTFQGETLVRLLPGFEASFIDFTARTGPCGSGVIPTLLPPGEEEASPYNEVVIEEVEASNNEEQSRKLALYPNPANSDLNLVFDRAFEPSKEVSIKILDNLGNLLLLREQNIVQSTQLDISSLPSGMYFIRLDWDEGKVVSRFIKL